MIFISCSALVCFWYQGYKGSKNELSFTTLQRSLCKIEFFVP